MPGTQLDSGQRVEFASSPRASGSLAVMPPQALFEAAKLAHRNLRLIVRQPRTGGLVVVVFRQGEPTMVFSPGDGRSIGELLLAAGVLDRDAVEHLVAERAQGPVSLQRFLLERTTLSYVDVQRFLDFQARSRLLDALTWDDGFFSIEEYDNGDETSYDLALPSLDSLVTRARARASALPDLLARLPAGLPDTLVRRRRGAARPLDGWEREVFGVLETPLLLPQVVARLLVDDDVVLGAVTRMTERRQLVLAPRVALAPSVSPPLEPEPGGLALIRDFLVALRGPAAGDGALAVWVVVVAASAADATRFVALMGGEQEFMRAPESSGSSVGIAFRTVRLGKNARLCLLAVRPDALSRGALGGILARCEGLVMLRTGKDPEEAERLGVLADRVLESGSGWQPLLLGVDVGAGLRAWDDRPHAVLGLGDPTDHDGAWLARRLLEGLEAAISGRRSRST